MVKRSIKAVAMSAQVRGEAERVAADRDRVLYFLRLLSNLNSSRLLKSHDHLATKGEAGKPAPFSLAVAHPRRCDAG